MAGNGHGRPGSAGFKYRHGWVPVAGTGAVDKRSKAKQRKTPSAPPNPAATPSNPTASPADAPKRPTGPRRWEGVSNKELDKYEAMYRDHEQANDLAPDMRSSITQALEGIKQERQHRERNPTEGITPIDYGPEPQHDYTAGKHNRSDLKPGTPVVASVDGNDYRGTISHEPSAHDGEVIVDLDPDVEGPDGDYRVEAPVDAVETVADIEETLGPNLGIGAGTHNRPELFPGRAVYANVDGNQYRGTISHEPSPHNGEVIVELDPGVEGPDGDYRVEASVDDVELAGARPGSASDPFAARMNSPEMNVQSSHPGGGDVTKPGARVSLDAGWGEMHGTVSDEDAENPGDVRVNLDEEGPDGEYFMDVDPADLSTTDSQAPDLSGGFTPSSTSAKNPAYSHVSKPGTKVKTSMFGGRAGPGTVTNEDTGNPNSVIVKFDKPTPNGSTSMEVDLMYLQQA